ncbi:hypothetical protein ACFWA5_23055 [Streptomyces mirabilis]
MEIGRLLRTRIDRFLVSRDFQVDSAHFVSLPGSDHRGLVVGLELRAESR